MTLRLEELLSLFGDDREMVKSLIAMFFQQSDIALDQLRGALEAGDRDTIRALSHKLRGSAGNLRAEDLFEAAARLEDAVKAGEDEERLRALGKELSEQFTILRAFAESELDLATVS